jgi:superfamily II DNA/RNA helicase
MPKKRQTDIIDDFKEGKCHVIVTYPDSMRGISMDHFPVVVNYSLPSLPEDYCKRYC